MGQLVLLNLEHVIVIIIDTQSDQCDKEDRFWYD